MRYIYSFLISSLLMFSGCSHIITKDDNEALEKYYQKVNHICENENELTILSEDSNRYVVKDIIIKIDSTSFYKKGTNYNYTIPTKSILEIRYFGTGTSVFEGALFGGLGGGIIGNIVSNPSRPGLEKAGSVLIGIGIGSIIGVIYSLINPPNTIIRF